MIISNTAKIENILKVADNATYIKLIQLKHKLLKQENK